MDEHYKPFHREAEALQNSFHARLSDPFNPMAMIMKGEADQLVEDIAANRHPQDIEQRISSIQSHLRRSTDTVSGDGLFNRENSQYLHSRYGRMRYDLQQLQQKPYYDRPHTQQPRTPGDIL